MHTVNYGRKNTKIYKLVAFKKKLWSFLACQNSIFNQITKLEGSTYTKQAKKIDSVWVFCIAVITQTYLRNVALKKRV